MPRADMWLVIINENFSTIFAIPFNFYEYERHFGVVLVIAVIRWRRTIFKQMKCYVKLCMMSHKFNYNL